MIRASTTGLRKAPGKLLEDYSERVDDLLAEVEAAEESAEALRDTLPTAVAMFGDNCHDHCDSLAVLLGRAADRFAHAEPEYWELKRLAAELGPAIEDLRDVVESMDSQPIKRFEGALGAALAHGPYFRRARFRASHRRRQLCTSTSRS